MPRIHPRNPSHRNRSLLFFFSALLLISGCAQLSSWQTGRTCGASGLSLNWAGMTDRKVAGDVVRPDSVWSQDYDFEAGIAVGVTDRLDVQMQMGSTLSMRMGLKYRLAGTNESPLAAAAGLGLEGRLSFDNTIFDSIAGYGAAVHLPLYLSWYPHPKVGIYATPRYIRYYLAYRHTGDALGGSGGLMYHPTAHLALALEASLYRWEVTGLDPGYPYRSRIGLAIVLNFPELFKASEE